MSATGVTVDGRKHTVSLEHVAKFAGWPTPRAEDSEFSGERVSRGTADTLTAVTRLAGWATPKPRDHKTGSAGMPPRGDKSHLDAQVFLAGWATPKAYNGTDRIGSLEAALNEADRRGPNTALGVQAHLAGWATPTEGDAKASGSRNTTSSKAHPGASLTDQIRGDLGTGRSGSSASTAKRGALSPLFSLWLMLGNVSAVYAWASCAPARRGRRRESGC